MRELMPLSRFTFRPGLVQGLREVSPEAAEQGRAFARGMCGRLARLGFRFGFFFRRGRAWTCATAWAWGLVFFLSLT